MPPVIFDRKASTPIPNAVRFSRELTPSAKTLYTILACYAFPANECAPGYGALMEDMDCDRKSLMRYIRELKDAGFVISVRRGLGQNCINALPSSTPEVRP